MANVYDIRTLIKENRDELSAFGNISAVAINSGRRGRPGTAYYLNEEQALLVCTLSRTERAKQVRAMLIKVFVAWRRGRLQTAPQPQLPQSYAEALRALAAEVEERERLVAAHMGEAIVNSPPMLLVGPLLAYSAAILVRWPSLLILVNQQLRLHRNRGNPEVRGEFAQDLPLGLCPVLTLGSPRAARMNDIPPRALALVTSASRIMVAKPLDHLVPDRGKFGNQQTLTQWNPNILHH